MGDMIDRDAVLERLELAEHDAEERDWRSGANEIARLRRYVAAIPAIPAIPACAIVAAAQAREAALLEALQWCSGSDDFQEGGKAREGWLKLCAPLLIGGARRE